MRQAFWGRQTGGFNMRRWFAIGVTLTTTAAADAQFAVDRTPPAGPAPITLAPPAAPVTPTLAPTAPPSFSQVAAEAPKPTEPPPSAHPWYVKPEHGQWMIVVKSYRSMSERVEDPATGQVRRVRIEAKPLAEALAKEIRETYKAPAYLFERGSDERRKEEARVQSETQKRKSEQEREFLALNDRLREEAFKKGYEFRETKPKYMVPSIPYEDEWAVVVGGWKDMETARKALDVIRTWNEPGDKRLMDRGFVGGAADKGQKTTLTGGYLNPFKLAFVAPNPTAAKTLSSEAGSDPLVIQMNKEEPLSVLKTTKPWTIVVKAYYAPLVDLKDKDAGSIMSVKKLFSSKPDHLDKTANLAVNLAKLLRAVKPTPYEAYVLHTLNGSLVCVGQFDSAEDPLMLKEQQRLESLRLNVGNEQGTSGNKVYPFDRLAAMRVR